MPVRGGDRHAEAPADLSQGELADAPFGYQFDRGVDERRLEIAVVVAAALGGALRWRS
jgi:hypothetical protein